MKIDIKKIKKMREMGKSLPVIAKYFGVSKSLISLKCQSFSTRGLKMTKNTQSIYPQLAELRKDYLKNKLSLEKIALKNNISRSTLTIVFKREKIDFRSQNETRDYLRKLGLYKKNDLHGKNNPNFKEGKYCGIKKHSCPEYHTIQYKKWRKDVFERDNFQCKECGALNNLNAHHITPIRENSLRFYDISNGITLCESCHQKTYFREFNFAKKYFSLIQNTTKVGV